MPNTFSEDWAPPNTPVIKVNVTKELDRPKFSVIVALFDFCLPLGLICLGIWYLGSKKVIYPSNIGLCYVYSFIGYVLLRLKQLFIWGILLYQRYAAEYLRRACVFEPTCSEYMLLSIIRYGLLPGIGKGVDRLLRCHSPNGGIDNP